MRLAFLVLVLINLLDFITTSILIDKFGFWIEANPLLTFSMVQANSVYPIIIHKFIFLFMFALFMWILYKRRPDRYKLPIWTWIVWIINLALLGVVIRSTYAILNI
jgi:hypothetical protein